MFEDISLASISDSIIEEDDAVREAKKKLKIELTELGTKSNFHGLGRLLTRPVIIKLIWLPFMLMSIGLCTYTIVNNIQQYLQFDVNTLVQVVPQNTVRFPTVTVCNLNPLITKSAFDYISIYYSNTYNVTLTSYTQFYNMVNNKLIPDDIDWLFYQTFDSQFNRTLRDSFGFSFDSQNLWCKVSFYPCNTNEFRPVYHPKYGNCFIFNSGVQANGSAIGVEYVSAEAIGIEMGIFTGMPDTKKPYFSESFNKGIVLIVGDQNATSLDQDGILVRPGLYADISLTKSTAQNLPKPYNHCYETVKTVLGIEMATKLNMSYDRRNCFVLCKQMITIEKLGCYDMRYPRLFNATACNEKASFEKLKSIELDLDKCQNECPFECETTIYDWAISYSSFPNYYSFKIINNTNYYMLRDELLFSNQSYSYSDMKQVVASFFIYFEPMTITQITQSPSMTIIDLIANIGGTFGLFMGLSALSIVEFIEMGIITSETFIKSHTDKKLKLRKTTKEEPKQRKEMFSEILKEIKHKCLTTTLHGLPNILSSKRLHIKLIWIMSTFLSVSFCIFMIFRSITSYLQFDLSSQIREVPQQRIKLPSVLICNPNYFVTREASNYLNEFYLKNNGRNFTTMDEIYEFTNETFFYLFSFPFYQTHSPTFNKTLRKSFGYSLDDMLLYCEFDSKPCNRSWFEWQYHPMFGNCYGFNTGFVNGVPNAIDHVSLDRPNVGLYIELFTGLPDDYYNFYLHEYEYTGINLYIGDHGHLPIEKYGKPFRPGQSASINFRLTHFVNLPSPYTDCQYAESIDTEIVRRMRQFNISYDRFNCIALCVEMLNAQCGCYLMPFPNIYGFRLCETFDDCMSNIQCPIDVSVCPIMCPAECEQNLYEYEISYSDFPSRNYAYKLINDRYDHYTKLFQTTNITYDMFKKSVNSFYFYFGDLVVNEIIEQPSMQFVDLVSNIGGVLGLFVGLSVLSFVEIIELVINIIKIMSRFRDQRYLNNIL